MEGTFPAGPRLAHRLVWSVLALSALAAGLLELCGDDRGELPQAVREDPDPNLRYVAYAKLACRTATTPPTRRPRRSGR